MNLKTKQTLAAGAAALVAIGGGVGGALAASGPSTVSKAQGVAATAGPGHFRRLAIRRGIFRVTADYLGLTRRELFQQLRSGKSLAEVATAQGKTVDGLKTAILDAVKTRLDKAVTNSRITTAQEQTFLDRLKTRLDTLVNRHFGHPSP
jgi:hypothetical protein